MRKCITKASSKSSNFFHLQETELHYSIFSSMALVSARYTLTALEVSELLAATHLYSLCQALDLRAMHAEMCARTTTVTRTILSDVFGEFFAVQETLETVVREVLPDVLGALDQTTGTSLGPRMEKVAGASVAPLLKVLASSSSSSTPDFRKIIRFREILARWLEALLTELRCAFMGLSLDEISSLSQPLFNIPSMGKAPASRYLAPRTRILYEFVRIELGIPMAGGDNLRKTVYGMRARDRVVPMGEIDLEEAGLGKNVDTTIGDKVSIIVEAIRDGRVARVMARMCQGVDATVVP